MPKKYDVMLPKGWKQEALHGSALSRRIHPRVSATHQLMGAYLSKGLDGIDPMVMIVYYNLGPPKKYACNLCLICI